MNKEKLELIIKNVIWEQMELWSTNTYLNDAEVKALAKRIIHRIKNKQKLF